LLNLFALALIAFALTFVVLGLVQFVRTRQQSALIWTGVGVLALLVFYFFASRFAIQLFGELPFALDLPSFATTELLLFLIGALAVAGAVGIFFLARRNRILALALGIGTALGLLVLIRAATIWSAQAAAAASVAIDHPGLASINLPEGFRVREFAAGVQEPNSLAFDDAGNLYYTELLDGNIVRLRDTNGDGVSDERNVFASGFNLPRGLAWNDGKLYVSSRGQINALTDSNDDGTADQNELIKDGLFSLDIQHSNNGIAFGPDGKLYLAIGGPRIGELELRGQEYWFEGEPSKDWQFAGVMQMDSDGKNAGMFATGLRNPYALAFNSAGQLFATDNGDESIPDPDGDELNLIQKGEDYGYPYYFGIPPPWAGTRAPLIRFTPHTAPTGLVAYEGDNFPAEYRDNIITALYWRGLPGNSYRAVARIVPTVQDGITKWELHDFISGLDRPIALAVGPDGALYIADMRGGKADPEAPGAIYRVTYGE
jgi:glucose/arabinose dehydrogenase